MTTVIQAADAMMAFAPIRNFLVLAALYGGTSFAAMPHFSLPIVNGSEGEVFDSRKSKNHLLIEFYFNGCPACNKNAPEIEKIAKEFHGERTKILEIGVDCDASDYQDWMRKHPPKGLLLNSCEGTIQDELKVTGYPTSFIFDCDGNQMFKHIGVWNAAAAAKAREVLTNLQFKQCNK